MEININTKFEIGQEVYAIEKVGNTKIIKEICPICEGVGNFIHNGHKIFCANCGGHGYHETGRKKITQHIIGKHGKVSSMRLQIPGLNAEKPAHDADVKYLRYKVGGRFFPEYLIFATEQEAIEACKELDNSSMNCDSEWHDDFKEHPKAYTPIIVMDKDGRELKNHQWTGYSYYEYIDDGQGGYDGYPSEFDIVKWRYKTTEKSENGKG